MSDNFFSDLISKIHSKIAPKPELTHQTSHPMCGGKSTVTSLCLFTCVLLLRS